MLFYYDQEDYFVFALEQWFSLNLQQNGVFSMGLCNYSFCSDECFEALNIRFISEP